MDLNSYLNSGIIQAYVLGIASPEEMQELESYSDLYPEIDLAIHQFSLDLEKQAVLLASKPPAVVKTNVMASLDLMDRMMKGEKLGTPPLLSENSKIEDYAEWLDRPDMKITGDFDGMFAKVIGHSPELMTAIVWMQNMNTEIHSDEIESFLVVEGSCEVTIGNNVYHLFPGDMMSIPLGFVHKAVSTSAGPCKVILQKLAA